MSEYTGHTQLSAFLVPHAKLDADHIGAASTFVESNPATSSVLPDDGVETALALKASGDPEVGDDIMIRVARGGIPDGLRGLALLWRNAEADAWVGWDSWGLQTQYRLPAWDTSTTLGYQKPDLLALPNGVLVMCFDEPILASRRAVKVRRWDPATLAWDTASTTVFAEPGVNVSENMHPCMCRLPSGKILLFHLFHSTDYSQVWSWISGDDGLTWERGPRDVLPEMLDRASPGAWSLYQMRVAYGRGQICLALGYNDSVTYSIARWASRDGGNHFELIETLAPDASTSLGLVYVRDQFLIVGSSIGGGVDGSMWRGGDAFSSFSALTATPSADWDALDGEVALAVDEQGNVIAIAGYDSGEILFSPDVGDTWAPLHVSTAGLYVWGGSLPIINMAAQIHRGRLCLVGNYYDAGAVYGIVEVQVGGYSTVTMPEKNAFDLTTLADQLLDASPIAPRRLQVPWSTAWMGFTGQLGNFTTWTISDTGTPTYGVTAGYEAIACGAGDVSNADYETLPDVTYFEVIAEGSLDQSTGTSVVQLRCSRSGGGGNITRVTVTISATAITLDDDLGAGTATIALPGLVDFKCSLKGTDCTLWARANDGDTVRRWTLVGSLTGLTESNGAAPNVRVRRTVSASSVANWYEMRVHFDEDHVIDETLSDAQAANDKYGRPAAGLDPMYLDDGVSVKVLDGPGYPRETFTMLGGGARPIERAFPGVAPSPQVYAEIDNGDDIDVVMELGTDPEDIGNDLLGVYLDAAIYAAEVYGDDGGGDVLLATLETSIEVGFVRQGDTVIPPQGFVASTAAKYWERNELVGGWVVLDPNGDDIARQIVANTEGSWSEGTLTEKRPTLTLSGVATDTDPSSGTMIVVFPRSTATVALLGDRDFQSLTLRINPTSVRAGYPAPPWGTVRIHVLAIGPVAVLGWSPARDHSTERESLASITELPSGAKWSRRRNARTRKIVEFSVSSDGIDITPTRGTHATNPDYVRASSTTGAEPVAVRRDAPVMLEGLLDELDGPGGLVVWLPRWDVGGDDVQTQMAQRAGGALYGRIDSSARLENVVGRPHEDQVVRGPRVVLIEEV